MRKINLYSAVIIIFILSGVSCKKSSCFLKKGKTTDHTISTGDFKKLIITDDINIILSEDTTLSCVVEADENMIPFISIINNQETLIISNKLKCEWLRPIENPIILRLNVRKLQQITYSGRGFVKSSNMLASDTFIINSKEGSGNLDLQLQADFVFIRIDSHNTGITITGTSNFTSVFCNTYGQLNLEGFQTRHLDLRHAGVNDIKVHASVRFDATLYYSGNVYLKGNPPEKNIVLSGKGIVINN